MFIAAFVISLIIIIPGTILVSSLIVRRFGTQWRLLGLGVLAYLVGEILRNPIMSSVATTDFYKTVVGMSSPMPLIFVYAFSLALFQFVVRAGGFWAAFRFTGDQARPRGGAMTFAAGFSGIDAFFTYGFALLYTLLLVINISQTAAPPEGVSQQDFAAAQSQVQQFMALPLLDALIHAQILPAFTNFVVQFAVSMILWVGMVGKKWPWLVAGFLWEAALVSLQTISSEVLSLYALNHDEYGLNLLVGSFILVLLILVNLGVIYVIFQRVGPLLGDAVKAVPRPAPAAAKPAPGSSTPAEKPANPRVPSKKLKNTDLK
jgi:hypothetical protein